MAPLRCRPVSPFIIGDLSLNRDGVPWPNYIREIKKNHDYEIRFRLNEKYAKCSPVSY